MPPIVSNPDDFLSSEPTSAQSADLQASAENLPVARERSPSGLFSKRHRLPADCNRLANEMASIREQLEAAVMARHGEINIFHAAAIDSVLTHHKRLRLLERWLVRPKHVRQTPGNIDRENTTSAIELSERVKILKEESAASDARAKAINALSLGPPVLNNLPWDQIFPAVAQAVADSRKGSNA